MIWNFWWGEDEDKRKVHWESWDVLTRPKNFGRVGFRDLKLLNQAMLARQCWKIINNPDSLCGRILKSIYYSIRQEETSLTLFFIKTPLRPGMASNMV
jgi:hypothetical protein